MLSRMYLLPFVAEFVIAIICTLATSRTSTMVNIILGIPNNLSLSICLTMSPEVKSVLIRAGPRIIDGFITVKSNLVLLSND